MKRGREVEAGKRTSKKKGESFLDNVQFDTCGPNSTETFENHVPHISDPNWGDTPSSDLGLDLMKLALQKYNQDIVQLVKERPDVFAWVELAFGGGLHMNSFVDDDIWYHINFKAKVVVNAIGSQFGEDGPSLLFAELKRSHGKLDYQVVSCHNLGPFSKFFQNPRLRGCKACDRAPFKDLLKHPNREFNVGPLLNYVKDSDESSLLEL